MSHVTHINESCHASERVLTHIWTSHVTCMNESWHTHIWIGHVTHMKESSHTDERVMSHIHVTHTNESCHTYERAKSHVWMSHVTHMNDSHHIYERVVSHMKMRQDWHMDTPWGGAGGGTNRNLLSFHQKSSVFVHLLSLVYPVWHNSFVCVTWLIHRCEMT